MNFLLALSAAFVIVNVSLYYNGYNTMPWIFVVAPVLIGVAFSLACALVSILAAIGVSMFSCIDNYLFGKNKL